MAAVKLVLLEDVENLGHVGDVVSVRGGFGRNYLIPQGKALPATKGNMSLLTARKKVYEVAAAQARAEAQAIADRIAAVSVSIARKVGESQTLYGSVTSADVAEALAAKGVIVDKRRVLLSEPIKQVGDYQVPVRLHADVTAELKVSVVAS
jgi:large subunit ribosomal protein L9